MKLTANQAKVLKAIKENGHIDTDDLIAKYGFEKRMTIFKATRGLIKRKVIKVQKVKKQHTIMTNVNRYSLAIDK